MCLLPVHQSDNGFCILLLKEGIYLNSLPQRPATSALSCTLASASASRRSRKTCNVKHASLQAAKAFTALPNAHLHWTGFLCNSLRRQCRKATCQGEGCSKSELRTGLNAEQCSACRKSYARWSAKSKRQRAMTATPTAQSTDAFAISIVNSQLCHRSLCC